MCIVCICRVEKCGVGAKLASPLRCGCVVCMGECKCRGRIVHWTVCPCKPCAKHLSKSIDRIDNNGVGAKLASPIQYSCVDRIGKILQGL